MSLDLSYGLPVVVIRNDRAAEIGRVGSKYYEYNKARENDVSIEDQWEADGRPYTVYVDNDDPQPIIVPESSIRLLDNVTNVTDIQPERFGETADSAKAFLDRFIDDLVDSTIEGHTKLATADPHYWVVWDRLDSIVVPDGHPYDRIEVVDDDAQTVYDPIEYLLTYAFTDWNDESFKNDLLRALNKALRTASYDPKLSLVIDDDALNTYDVDGVRVVTEPCTNDTRKPTNSEIEALANAVIEFGDLGDDVHVVHVRDVWGPAPHCMFLTKRACELYLKANWYHHAKGAHPYLDCAPRSYDFERLLSVLRQLDVEHSHFAMRPDPAKE